MRFLVSIGLGAGSATVQDIPGTCRGGSSLSTNMELGRTRMLPAGSPGTEQPEDDAAARRAYQQSALFRFTDRLYRARSLDQAYGAALDAISEMLGCSRASILRFDDGGRLRFVAWRGLSEQYRAAVEGHSPWKMGEEDPQPLYLADIRRAD